MPLVTVIRFVKECLPFFRHLENKSSMVVDVWEHALIRNASNIVKAPREVTESGWTQNSIAMQPYRFALVMENRKHTGYMTEKIINAFTGGAIPIYYGTIEVFDIFHRDAFVYYDIDNPRPALDRIAYLDGNQTAYNEIIKGPILKNGEETIRKYFSWNDELGNGEMKWVIRDFIGYG